MKLLVLSAAWAPDESENTQRWLNWYRDVLDTHFHDDGKFIAVNTDAHELVETRFRDVSRLLDIKRVPENLHINSDAGAFQFALDQCRQSLENYDYVLFLHTKGISYPFADYDGLRPLMQRTIFDRRLVAEAVSQKDRLVCFRGHMSHANGSIVDCAEFASSLGISRPTFNFAATMTIYYSPATALRDFISRLPAGFLSTNLVAQGKNRFFFEGVVPSTLVMLGIDPVFLDRPAFDARLNAEVSYNHAPNHNSALVSREFYQMMDSPEVYRQTPIPYVFGDLEDLVRITIAYHI